jgi:hypothetical protein
VEVDNAPEGAAIDLSLGRFRDGVFEAEVTEQRDTARRLHVGFGAGGSDGALLFDASVKDWSIALDTGRIVGRRDLRARLLDRSGFPVQVVYQTVTLDDSAPDAVKFVDVPPMARRDAPLAVKAFGAASASGISRVLFFLGKPVENKVPPNTPTYPGEPANEAKTLWTATIPLSGDHKGPTEISVQFISGVDLSTFATTSVDLIDNDPAKVVPGSIRGTVVEGALEQPDLDVILKDEKGTEKDRTKTKDGGSFVFAKVAPGKYKVSTSKRATNRADERDVEVVADKASTVALNLHR